MEFKVQKLTTNQLKDRLKKDWPYLLVDVRETEAFMKGHIPGASHMLDVDTISMAKKISKGTDIIVYGQGTLGQHKLNDVAAETFMNLGSKYVFSYEDGLKGWSDGGNRVDRSDRSDQKLT
ncbi:MAG TPA: rhodanese-like domain-containing protein [Methanocella sp.]|jgi:rhodanese-related sulfurtransferase